jgi:hypothetical protein
MHLHVNGNNAIPPANGSHVLEVLRRAEGDLANLLQERAEVTKRIGTVKQLIAGLANLFGDEILSEDLLALLNRKVSVRQRGFTGACRMVLMQAKAAQSAREVCEQVQQRVPLVMARHKDPVASVTTVLNRLTAYGEARSTIRADGRRAFAWVTDEGEDGAE